MAVPELSAADARSIENLVYAYAERIDAGDFEGVAELFAHGLLVPAPGVALEGTGAVLRLYRSTTRLHDDGTPRTKHVTTNVTIELDDAGTPCARSYFTVLQAVEGLPLQAIIAGRYHDTFQLLGGRWCFASREVFVDLTGDLSRHLLIDLG